MKALRYFFLLVLHCLYSTAFSQKNHIQFDHLGTAGGLSQSNVTCIMQDSHGFMWFGTWNGLNKYDGYTVKVYKNDPLDQNSISNNDINNIAESKNGDLWIATGGGGMCHYDRNNEDFKRYMHDPKNVNSISDDVVNSIYEDEQGKLWIGTNEGLDIFDPVTNKFQHFTCNPGDKNGLSGSRVKYIFEDKRHDLWICTSNGINLFNSKAGTFKTFQNNKNNPKSIGSDNVSTIFEDSKHHLWIGTDGGGLDLFDQKTGIFSHFKHEENNANSLAANFIHAINEDAENNLWIGTDNGGLSVFNYATRLFTNYRNDLIDKESISNNSINCIYRDSKNNMWLGTFDAGVDLANRDKTNFTHYKKTMLKNSLSDNHVLSIFEDKKKNIWVGTDGGGLNLFDPRMRSFKHFRHEKNNEQSICGNHVVTACEDSQGNIWIGTWADGVTLYNPANNTFKHFKNNPANPSSLSDNNAWIIHEDKDKNVWIGTSGGGLNLLNPDHNSFTRYQYDRNRSDGISATNIISIFEDSDGELWICTEAGGLNLFNKKSKTFSYFMHDDTKNSISNNNLSSMFEDSDKNLWIATRMGLNQFNKKNGQFKVYTMTDGLPGNEILGILEDGKKNLWISTNGGISRFNLLTKLFKNFGVPDGLQSNEFKVQAFCKSRAGMMYFGGNNGFNQFFPDSIKTIPFDPPLVITNFQIFNKEVSLAINKNDNSPLTKNINETSTITLPYSNTVFSFEFATLNYTASEKKRYAYMLEGFDKSWNEVSTLHTATYTNLDPGKYVFKVKGLNNEGEWSSNIKSIELTITPPYWLTWWFKSIVLLLIISGIFGFYKFRINIIHAQKRKLEQRVLEQTEQLIKSTQEAQRARKEAEQANIDLETKNKEMEQFAYIASHDLQEPLRTTSSFVKLLQKQYEGKFDEKADKYFTFISEASDRMKMLIKNLLDFSRIGNKKELEQVDCDKILSNVLADLGIAISESRAEIIYDPLPIVNGYATELKQLFQNLITNAIKFRKKETPSIINISVQKNESTWQFQFKDNGIGIDEKYNEKIFVIFQRLHTQAEYEGSGIGLSHCKKIVELHKGKIWVESRVGEGSIFSFTIPQNNNYQKN
ncbi:MAG TPA: two-component regulator propeller domain-containing protein [Chitinophagaceae bacterium]|nr:two-component regulator propeller domain-containing protein [Chitinophagaceae bacterium]